MLYTVYGLHEAGKPDEIQYVGCTSKPPKERLDGHKAARNRFNPVNRWVARVMDSGKHVACRALLQTEDEAFALQMEKEMIAYIAARGGLIHNVVGVRRRSRVEYLADKEAAELARTLRQDKSYFEKEDAELARTLRREKVFADGEAAVAAIRAMIADGSLDIQAILAEYRRD